MRKIKCAAYFEVPHEIFYFYSVLIWNTFTLSAQDTSILTEKLSYGVSGYVTIATAREINDDRPPYGYWEEIYLLRIE